MAGGNTFTRIFDHDIHILEGHQAKRSPIKCNIDGTSPQYPTKWFFADQDYRVCSKAYFTTADIY